MGSEKILPAHYSPNMTTMNIISKNQQEMDEAVNRSLLFGLIPSAPELGARPRLASERLRVEVAEICLSMAPGRFTGLCQLIATLCIGYVKKRLQCNAWIVFGWLSDHSKPGSYFWKMDPDDLCRALTTGCVGSAEFHAWIMLDSGEIIDPVVYPTMAEIFKDFPHGAGQCHFLLPEGRPYNAIYGLPPLQYHPQAILA